MAIEMPSIYLGYLRVCLAERAVSAHPAALAVGRFCYADARRANSMREIDAVANNPMPATTNAGP